MVPEQAYFLASVDAKTFALCQDLLAPEELDTCSLEEIKKALKSHYDPVKNITYERYLFNARCIKSRESISDYVHTLKAIASNCEFGNFLNNMLRDRLVVGLKNQKIHRALLGVSKLN